MSKTLLDLRDEWCESNFDPDDAYIAQQGFDAAIKAVCEKLKEEKKPHEKIYEAHFWAGWIEGQMNPIMPRPQNE